MPDTGVQLDHFSVVLLILRPDAPILDDAAAARLQDAHMAHLAGLHEGGYLIAAGPLSDEKFRGLNILNVKPETARVLAEQDPAVLAGRFSVKVIPWIVPRGAVSYSRTRFPRSVSRLSES
ncbi:MAG: YciI family protein [Candidatus Dormibacteraeota bacterium]|nr:YciI family protein [Candidatus Dormibacteraeota bacterium]